MVGAQIVFCAHSRSGEIEDVRAVELQGVVRMARELQVLLLICSTPSMGSCNHTAHNVIRQMKRLVRICSPGVCHPGTAAAALQALCHRSSRPGAPWLAAQQLFLSVQHAATGMGL